MVEPQDTPKLRVLAVFSAAFSSQGFSASLFVPGTQIAEGIHQLGYVSYASLVRSFVELCYRFSIVIQFDWASWKEGDEGSGLLNSSGSIDNATPTQLYKLVTLALRSERFVEGSLASFFERGIVQASCQRARQILEDNWYKPSDWIEEYYSSLEHFFWEPQHLNARRTKTTSWSTVKLGLQRSEVVLNHLLNLLLCLLPGRCVQQLVSSTAPGWQVEPLSAHSRPRIPDLNSQFCQPDVLLVGDDTLVAIEIKIKAKITIDQLTKYAIFLNLYAAAGGRRPRQKLLIVLTPTSHSGVEILRDWRSELPAAKLDFKGSLRKFIAKQSVSGDDLIKYAGDLDVIHLSYDQLVAHLWSVRSSSAPDPQESETVSRLVEGFVLELLERGLIEGQGV